MLLALTTDQKLGLAGTAAVFIVFSLVTALLIPRYRPDFPGRRGVGAFVVVTLVLMVGMLGAVVVFANEEETGAHAAEPARLGPGERDTEETQTGATATEPAPPPAAGPPGSAEAGERVFAANGCGSCHVFEAANTTGAVGPNLDESLEGKDADYVRRAIVDPNADIAEGFQPGVMPPFENLSDKQLDDLVAFLTAS